MNRRKRSALRLSGGTAATFQRNYRKSQVAARETVTWNGPECGYAAMSTTHRGATAKNVLVTSRERAWRAPSGARANGVPNTYIRVALGAGRDRSCDLTAESEQFLRDKYKTPIRHDGPDAGLTVDGRGRRFQK